MTTSAPATVDEAVDASVRLLIRLGLGAPAGVFPASEAELEGMEKRYGILPRAYQRFLERMGRGADGFMRGTTWFLPDILLQRDGSKPIAAPNGTWSLGRDQILIAHHQGYLFWFLDGPGDDPAVMGYREGAPNPARLSPRFTDWLADTIRRNATERWEMNAHGEIGDGRAGSRRSREDFLHVTFGDAD
jgi:hypothetical protein